MQLSALITAWAYSSPWWPAPAVPSVLNTHRYRLSVLPQSLGISSAWCFASTIRSWCPSPKPLALSHGCSFSTVRLWSSQWNDVSSWMSQCQGWAMRGSVGAWLWASQALCLFGSALAKSVGFWSWVWGFRLWWCCWWFLNFWIGSECPLPTFWQSSLKWDQLGFVFGRRSFLSLVFYVSSVQLFRPMRTDYSGI